MVSFSIIKVASVLALISGSVQAAPSRNVCKDFHVTSPTSYFYSTAGQCYQVSYDYNGRAPSNPSWVTVELYEYGSDKYINTLVNKHKADGIATPWFNLDLGKYHKSGEYYYRVTYDGCKPIKTTRFHVEYNKNSPPSNCGGY